jgi:hypothetical protein
MNPSFPKWQKKGVIFKREDEPFFKTHTTRPIPFVINKNVLRIFIFSRCSNDTMHPTYIDVNPRNPSEILTVCNFPIAELGKPGFFDDSGVSPGSILKQENKVTIYYTGWKRRRLVNFEFSIGVAELNNNYSTMKKVYSGPILAQDINHPILVGGPFVLKDGKSYKMWYCSGEKWIFPDHGPEPIYSVYYATSRDGVQWLPMKKALLTRAFEDEVITAPWVEKANGGWMMWYSYRGAKDIASKAYKIGVAYSSDGLNWQRYDELAGIATSSAGWDSEMICYPSFYSVDGRTIMLYCGNHVGREGIGWAESDQSICTQIQV